MSDYTSVFFKVSEEKKELLSAFIDDLGFEGIIDHEENGIEAFIPSELFDKESLSNNLKDFDEHLDFNLSQIKERNWNETWESNFQPVIIDDSVLIKASFHESDKKYPYVINIDPKMSFGTGHHATTSLVMSEMLEMDLNEKRVLDAGTGTGILAILAEKKGGIDIDAFDIEEWAYENALENVALNECESISVYQSDASALPFRSEKYDLIIANITLNILKADIPVYLNYLSSNGTLIISGFMEENISEMQAFIKNRGLEVKNTKVKNNWACMSLSQILN